MSSEHRQQLRRRYERATAEQLKTGRQWYGRAMTEVSDMAHEANVEYETAAGVVAAISPRMRWSANKASAAAYLRGEFPLPYPIFAANLAKATRIQEHGEPPLDVLGGPKTRAFYANLCGDATAVTVDIWMCRAMNLAREQPTPRQYRELSTDVLTVAADIGERPCDLQAIVWIVERGGAD